MLDYVNIKNNSKNNIFIALSSPENANSDFNNAIQLNKGDIDKFVINKGVMNLFIWENNNLIWKGIIPTSINNNIIFDGKNISYNNLIIPEGFGPVTSLDKKEKSNIIWIILFIITLGLLFLYIYFNI